MSQTSIYVVSCTVAYLLGSIPFGYILVKVFLKQDIRTTGSGNIGATNVARSGKRGLAIATLLLDAGKGSLAVYFAHRLWVSQQGRSLYIDCWLCQSEAQLMLLAALFAIIGHMYPLWLRFRGGKGVATGLGGLILVSPGAVLACALLFLIVVATTRYVSLGSIIAAAFLPFSLLLFDAGHPQFWGPYTWTAIGIAVLVIAKHHSNIRRLINGRETKFKAKKVPSPEQVEKQA